MRVRRIRSAHIVSSVYRITVPMIGQFLDVMHHAIQQPLDIHLDLPAQGEPIHPLLSPDVGKHRLHHPQSFLVLPSAVIGVDLLHHVLMTGRYRLDRYRQRFLLSPSFLKTL